MRERERWIAFVAEDGGLIEARELEGSPDDPTPSSYPGSHHAIAHTREEAEAEARKKREKREEW